MIGLNEGAGLWVHAKTIGGRTEEVIPAERGFDTGEYGTHSLLTFGWVWILTFLTQINKWIGSGYVHSYFYSAQNQPSQTNRTV